jgi:SAM-dependent methyltransferase
MLLWPAIVVVVAAAGWLAYRALSARWVLQESDRLATVLHLRPDSRVADIGAGGGAFAFALAQHAVPNGHVFATEIEEKGVERLRTRSAARGLQNVTAARGGEDRTALPEACCDAVLLRGVYHHITRPAEFNDSLLQTLRPGGRLAIVDFPSSWLLSTFFPVRGVPQNRGGHGVPADVVVGELEGAGFELIERHDDWGRGLYALVFNVGVGRKATL